MPLATCFNHFDITSVQLLIGSTDPSDATCAAAFISPPLHPNPHLALRLSTDISWQRWSMWGGREKGGRAVKLGGWRIAEGGEGGRWMNECPATPLLPLWRSAVVPSSFDSLVIRKSIPCWGDAEEDDTMRVWNLWQTSTAGCYRRCWLLFLIKSSSLVSDSLQSYFVFPLQTHLHLQPFLLVFVFYFCRIHKIFITFNVPIKSSFFKLSFTLIKQNRFCQTLISVPWNVMWQNLPLVSTCLCVMAAGTDVRRLQGSRGIRCKR